MDKELLTSEHILSDIRNYLKHTAPRKSKRIGNFLFDGCMLVSSLVFVFTSSPYAFLFLLIPFVWLLICALLKFRHYKSLSEASFSVSTERLIFVRETVMDVDGRFARYKKGALLLFENGDEWEVPYENYTWSETAKLSRKGVVNTSVRGDMFYLVRLNDTDLIAAAYNQKFFDYQKL